MERKELDTRLRLEAVKVIVDTAAQRHGQTVADVMRGAADTVTGGAKIVVFGAALGARYVAGFARGFAHQGKA